MRLIELSGRRFGRLSVVRADGKRGREVAWLCLCDCGKPVRVRGAGLRSGRARSCGCMQRDVVRSIRTTHGKSSSATYRIWSGMVQRCANPKRSKFDAYGGRGIKVCERWLVFENFLADMGERPDGMTIDRIDNDGNYEPGNCQWVSWVRQARNTRRTVLTESMVNEARGRHEHGESTASIARRLGVKEPTLRGVILRRAWKDVP